MPTLMVLLTEIVGLSQEAATALIDEFGEFAAQTHAMYCLWMMEQGKAHTLSAWHTASLKHNWNVSRGIPSDWMPIGLHVRVDENTFVQIWRAMREEKRAAMPDI